MTKELLSKLGVVPDKAFGQNFLLEPAVIDEILHFGKPSEKEKIVEIGPGMGALTKELANFTDLSVIEIEEKFCNYLREEIPNLTIYNEDVRFFDLSSIGSDLLIFGNLPYSFSSEILFYLLDNAPQISRAVLLLQKEFAERVASPPGSRAYGVLSVRTQLLANARLGPIFDGDIFYPKASVQSRLIELRFLKEPRFKVNDLLDFKLLLAASFGSRRRKIINSLQSSGQFKEDKLRGHSLSEVLEKAGIDPEERAEDLTLEQFVTLTNITTDLKKGE